MPLFLAIDIRLSNLSLPTANPLALIQEPLSGENPKPAISLVLFSLYPLVSHSTHLLGFAKFVPSFFFLNNLPTPLQAGHVKAIVLPSKTVLALITLFIFVS